MEKSELNAKLKDRINKTFCCIAAHILLNMYADEDTVFGHIKVNEKIPFEKYLDVLDLQSLSEYLDDLQSDGHAIENGCIKNRLYDEICFDLYRNKTDLLFGEAPKYKDSDEKYADDIFHFKYGLYEYLKELYTLFREIIEVEISTDFFTAIPDIIDKNEQRIYYAKIAKFVTAIKLKHLRQGSCVDRYVKDLPFISPLVRRLLKKQKGRYILANNDINSLDYKFALFSCFRFYNEKNAKLLELKILRWEELNK